MDYSGKTRGHNPREQLIDKKRYFKIFPIGKDFFVSNEEKDFSNEKAFLHYLIGLESVSDCKTGEARLAGQAAIEGLSAPMRLPSAISHTPKLSECPFEPKHT